MQQQAVINKLGFTLEQIQKDPRLRNRQDLQDLKDNTEGDSQIHKRMKTSDNTPSSMEYNIKTQNTYAALSSNDQNAMDTAGEPNLDVDKQTKENEATP